jgi:hypothetical protein
LFPGLSSKQKCILAAFNLVVLEVIMKIFAETRWNCIKYSGKLCYHFTPFMQCRQINIY